MAAVRHPGIASVYEAVPTGDTVFYTGELLTGDSLRLLVLGVALAAWGVYATYLAVRDPASLTRENHPSWRHMYLIMFALQIGFAVAFGVLLDTFVVRTTLVPAIIVLLGRWSWWPRKWNPERHSD